MLAACAAPGPRGGLPAAASQALGLSNAPIRGAAADAARQRFVAAQALKASGNLEAAHAEFLALNRDHPALSGPLTELGMIYARRDQRDRAVAAFEQAATVNPGNVVAINWLGTLHREAGNFEAAESAYQQAISLDPTYANAHFNLAVLYDVHFGQSARALEHYQAYLDHTEAADLIVQAWVAQIEAEMARMTASRGEETP
ncbi:MAG: tetratricopeptide repeat protein [Panacagrimonas sp.]